MQILCKTSSRYGKAAKARLLKEDHNEKHLWKAVICQAIEDANSRSTQQRKKLAKRRAIKWLTEDSDDFRAVCDLAGYDHKVVKRNALTLMQERT